jgi:hypothetical protein
MSSVSLAKARNLESAAPKKGSAKSNTPSRRKVPSTAATFAPRQNVGRWCTTEHVARAACGPVDTHDLACWPKPVFSNSATVSLKHTPDKARKGCGVGSN